MKHLTKYMKPYLALLILSVFLLFVQANAELALPDYMSRIVNVGIQQGGIEHTAPQVIRASELEKALLFLPADEQAQVLDSYTYIDSTSADYLGQYPLLMDEPLYVRNDNLNSDEIEALNPVMGRALLTVFTINRALENPGAAPDMGMGEGFDISQLPPGVDVFAMLANMPADQRAMITDRITEGFDTLGESMIMQSAVPVIQAEYEAIGFETTQLQNDYMLRIGIIMLVMSLVGGIASITVGYLSSRIAAGFARDVRRALFTHVENFSSVEFNQFSTASLITRSTNDITQIQLVLVMMIRMIVYAPILGIGGIIRATNLGSGMWWVIAVAVGLLMMLIAIVYVVAVPKFKVIQELTDRLNLVTRESLSGMLVIRAFNRQWYEEERFDTANQDLTDVQLFINRVMVLLMPFMMLIMNGIGLLIIWVGAQQVAQANMQVGDMIAFIQYAIQIVMSFLFLSMAFIILPRAQVSAERVGEVLATELTITDPPAPQTFPASFSGEIEFRDVSFRYPGAEENVLHDVSFIARPGQTTAFIGSTGSGKSTVLNLIPRFYDVSQGQILLDGIDIRDVTQHDLHDKIGYVPQKGVLFTGTLESNLRYADESADIPRLEEAAYIAQAEEFITAREEGWDAPVSQGGTNVSGGQRQRLSIARALVKKPPIYLFDDSFSALDFRTAAALRGALKETTGDSSILVVTQRVSSARIADQIIVMDQGRIVGKGTHDDLLATCQTYQQIAWSQLTEEELK